MCEVHNETRGNIWNKAKVPAIDFCHLSVKVRKLHAEHMNFKKNRSGTSGKAVEYRREFQRCLEELFNVAHCDALSLMKSKVDKDFLINQHRPG